MYRLLPLVLLVAACSGKPAPEANGRIPVKVVLNWYPEPEFGGLYEGVLDGTYDKAGFDVTLVPGGPGTPTLEMLGAGRADAALTMGDDLLVKRSKGIRAVAVWTAFQVAPTGLMAHAESGITKYTDIQGGQVAIEIGSAMQTYLWKKFDWKGRVEPVPYGGSVGPFLADPKLIQQAYITSEPCIAEAKGAQVTFLKSADAGWNPYASVLALPDPLPAWAGDFVAATQQAWQAYLKDPTRADAEIARLNDQLDPSLLQCISTKQAPFLTGDKGLGHLDKARWDTLNATLVDLGLLPKGTSADDAWKDVSKAP